ncbi:hypothetical protein Q5752_001936 [Cryptotrichosporon argae]
MDARYRPLPSLREQDALERRWVEARHDHIHSILKKHGYDAWLLSMREYAEDTAFTALVSSTTTFSARRRTLYLFHTSAAAPSPLVVVDNTDDLWGTLNATLFAVDPAKIAVDVDGFVAFADGLHTGEGETLRARVDPKYAARLEPSRAIPVEVVAARAGGREQLAMYRLLQENVWALIGEAFSARVVEVGTTTAADIEWWLRDVMRWRLGCATWFHPSVDIVRHPALPDTAADPVVRPGDVLHVDVGIAAMGLHTDTQHLGYVLRANETRPPAGLLAGLRAANRLQDFVRHEMLVGRTGDEVLAAVRARMAGAQLEGSIYSHPIGDRGHAAGAVIGMTNLQDGVPHLGSMKVLENYWTSVELAGFTYVPEWGTTLRFELEEDVYWNPKSKTFEWVWGQQTEFHLVEPKRAKPALEGLVDAALHDVW